MNIRLPSCVAVLIAGGLVLAGCAAPTTPAPRIDVPAESSSFEPIPVRGVQPCSGLSTNREQASDADAGLPTLPLPCLTEPGRVDTATLGGRPTLVNLWATWCGPCREEMPILQAAYTRIDREVQFVGIDTKDSPQMAAEFLGEVEVTYPQLVDIDGALLAHTRVPGLPVTLLLDEHGDEIARHIGPLDADQLADLLDQA